jgi:membrane-associated phospholipid phosphatase
MKKELYHYPIFILLILICISIIGIIFGTFFDLNISKSIVDTNLWFGGFIESFGLTIPFIMTSLAGVLLFKGLFPSEKKSIQILGIVLFFVCIGASIYFAGDYLTSKYTYGITFQTGIAYLIGSLYILLSTSLFMYIIKSDNKKGLIITACIIIGVILIQLGVIELLKNIASRPRYRYLISSQNIANDTFKYWYEFTPFSAKDDNFKSWPSGHTATSGVMLCLPLITPYIKKEHKYTKVILTIIGVVYPLLVGFYRLRYGAHYLSDVSFGLLIVTLIYTLCLFIGSKVDAKLER